MMAEPLLERMARAHWAVLMMRAPYDPAELDALWPRDRDAEIAATRAAVEVLRDNPTGGMVDAGVARMADGFEEGLADDVVADGTLRAMLNQLLTESPTP